MENQRPRGDAVLLRTNSSIELLADFAEENVDADQIRVQTIHAGRKNNIGCDAFKFGISPADKMIRAEPPDVIRINADRAEPERGAR